MSTDDKWRHKPSAGLHVPGLATEDVETFLDLVEQASALSDAMSENYRQLREVRNEVQSRGWSLWPSPNHLRSLKTKQAQYERDRAALQFKWDELEAEYQKAGFRDLQVTGFRVGTNSEYQQDWDRGKGLTNVVQAYRKSQEEDLRGGLGLEATGDEMAIITAPADLVGAVRLGSALIRTGYHVVKQGAGYVIRKRAARQAARTLTREMVERKTGLSSKSIGKPADREFREQMFDKMRALGAQVDKSKSAQAKLAAQTAEAMITVVDDADGNRILSALFGPSPTRSALYEECIHLIQAQKGGRYDQLVRENGPEQALIILEIEAKEEIIRNAKQWKIPYDEIDGLRHQIVDEKRKLNELITKD